MDKLGKVIEAFENCTAPEMNDDDDETFVDCIRACVCPWDDCQERGRKMIDIPLSLAMAALELLKAQEPVDPIEMIDDFYPIGDPLRTIGWKCGKCGERIAGYDNYCPNCGKAVKWE